MCVAEYLNECCFFRCPLLQCLDQIFALQLDADSDTATFEMNVVNVMRTAVKTFDVDKLWAAALAVDRILKPLQDMCIENSAGHHNRLCALELNSTDQVRFCIKVKSSLLLFSA